MNMGSFEFGILTMLLVASVISLLLPMVCYLIHKCFFRSANIRDNRLNFKYLAAGFWLLFFSIFCLRYSVGLFGIKHPEMSSIATENACGSLTWWEEIVNSLIHALQTFSMDENYTGYLVSGKAMVHTMVGSDSKWEIAYGAYSSILNFIAPVAGGAILFELLANIFPIIRLWMANITIWRKKYYFSELNERSLTLAESLLVDEKKKWGKPIVIFTDAYFDNEDEKKSEIWYAAKALGAICVKEDLSHVKKSKTGRCNQCCYFLIDNTETANLNTLAALTNSRNSKYIKNSKIYFFTNENTYVQIEKNIRYKLAREWHIQNPNTSDFPLTIIPVKSYKNLILNLLYEVPLYEPLIHKFPKQDGTRDLNVSIIGMGNIGLEMFLSTYWLGQILNINLKINVLSLETEEEFWNKIDYINPEIRRTTNPEDPILQINKRGDMSPVYCTVNYTQCDAKSSQFLDKLCSDENSIIDTDYYLISLGSDEDNISLANTIRRYVAKQDLIEANQEKPDFQKKDTIITYVVYNTSIGEDLNEKTHYVYAKNKNLYVRAIGSLQEVYSKKNISLDQYKEQSKSIHKNYIKLKIEEEFKSASQKRIDDAYTYWANLARTIHLQYKMFSVGAISESMLFVDKTEERTKYLNDAVENFQEFIYADMDKMEKQDAQEHLELLHHMAWLEHRRWNAFMRVQGFQWTDKYDVFENNVDKNGKRSYKQMDLMLHPCLVECDKKGIRTPLNADGKPDTTAILSCNDESSRDFLDDVTYALNRAEYNDYDFKQYDYLYSDYPPYEKSEKV